eukprot:CAMPEP_0174373744 /NCGR_PEP_ID=MMETSP0811_2-20130205/108305_1 /TAXON_ID=73025 ORGANISM="Eutreptiella gymnastica-like, Strain CCMP1594" /NCGR_SAMPLE_ID=MMETSP0811_2 /ASSEMBLY_ACC=CAM_ASM_000667 /LENGTH=72 /DNA_ID=CAMNT_0015522421 /DNA_START=164 /DNA_END=379 /DNA_ORIENTATION=-
MRMAPDRVEPPVQQQHDSTGGKAVQKEHSGAWEAELRLDSGKDFVCIQQPSAEAPSHPAASGRDLGRMRQPP